MTAAMRSSRSSMRFDGYLTGDLCRLRSARLTFRIRPAPAVREIPRGNGHPRRCCCSSRSQIADFRRIRKDLPKNMVLLSGRLTQSPGKSISQTSARFRKLTRNAAACATSCSVSTRSSGTVMEPDGRQVRIELSKNRESVSSTELLCQ
jgi:hypothetical protein